MVTETRPAGYSQIELDQIANEAVRERIFAKATIDKLDEYLELVPDDRREVFFRSYQFDIGPSLPSKFPEGTADLIGQRFKTEPEKLQREQIIVRVSNMVLKEESLFNKIRALRPGQNSNNNHLFEEAISQNPPETCDFCHSHTNTPIDFTGRLKGEYCTTVFNGASYDRVNALVIPTAEFHNPLKLTLPAFGEMLKTAKKWAEYAHAEKPEAKYPVITWNHGRKAGQSVFPHPHLGVSSALHRPYMEVESLRQRVSLYYYDHDPGFPYFDELAYALHPLGLVYPAEVGQYSGTDPKVFFHLTPRKEKEVLVTSRNFDQQFSEATYQVLDWYRSIGVTNFDMAIYLRPEGKVGDEWNGFPFVARIVDRGPDAAKNGDMGAMEIYVTPVVASDPFEMSRSFRQYLAKQT